MTYTKGGITDTNLPSCLLETRDDQSDALFPNTGGLWE